VINKFEDTILIGVTYPRFIQMPSGNLLFECRIGTSGYGDSYLWEYNGDLDKWKGKGIYINGIKSNENPYIYGIKYDNNGKLHVTWCWRKTSDPSTNQDLYYAFSIDDGKSWYDNYGNKIAIAGNSQIALNRSINTLKVWEIPENRGLINQESMTIDSEGKIHVLLSHLKQQDQSNKNFLKARKMAYAFHYIEI